MSPSSGYKHVAFLHELTGRQLLRAHQVYELRLSDLITGNRFLKGHQIPVQIPAQISASFFPPFSRNLQARIGKNDAKDYDLDLYRSHPSIASSIARPLAMILMLSSGLNQL